MSSLHGSSIFPGRGYSLQLVWTYYLEIKYTETMMDDASPKAKQPWLLDWHFSSDPVPQSHLPVSPLVLQLDPFFTAANSYRAVSNPHVTRCFCSRHVVMKAKSTRRQRLVLLLRPRDIQIPQMSLKLYDPRGESSQWNCTLQPKCQQASPDVWGSP